MLEIRIAANGAVRVRPIDYYRLFGSWVSWKSPRSRVCRFETRRRGLTKVAAMEHGEHNIRVNCVAPGATDTPMLRNSLAERAGTPESQNPSPSVLERFGAPEEVAQASLWLASDLSSYVTGTMIHVDGG